MDSYEVFFGDSAGVMCFSDFPYAKPSGHFTDLLEDAQTFHSA